MCNNNFNSLDRLLEFGMDMAVAQQMMRVMNDCMQQTRVPQVDCSIAPMPAPQTQTFFAVIGKNVSGPYNEAELMQLARAGQLEAETLVWREGMANWTMARKVPEINKCIILSGNEI